MYIPKEGYTAEQAYKLTKNLAPDFNKNRVVIFRNLLVRFSLCAPHELMTHKQLETMQEGVRTKREGETWEHCFTRVILDRHICEVPAEDHFKWDKKVIMEYLIDGVKRGILKVERQGHDGPDWLFYCAAMDNFSALGKSVPLFQGVRGCDGGVFAYRITAPNGDVYYTISVMVDTLDRHDLHLFGCRGGEFSPLSTTYIGAYPSLDHDNPMRKFSQVDRFICICNRRSWERENPDGDYDGYLEHLEEALSSSLPENDSKSTETIDTP